MKPPATPAPKDIFEAAAVIAELRETISTLQQQLDDAQEAIYIVDRDCFPVPSRWLELPAVKAALLKKAGE